MLVSSAAGAGLRPRRRSARAAGAAAAERLVSEAVQVYAQDLKRVNDGRTGLRTTWTRGTASSTPRSSPTSSPVRVGRRGRRLGKHRGRHEAEAGTGGRGSATEVGAEDSEETRVWLSSPLYPDYYLNTFHWQTDGWLSKASAEVYEVSTETLFGEAGRHAAHRAGAAQGVVRRDAGKCDRREREASGDGVRDRSVPHVHARHVPEDGRRRLDLSPFYLAEARENAEYWERFRAGDLKHGGHAGNARAVASLATGALRRVGSLAKAAGVPLPPPPAALRAAEETRDVDEKKDLGRCEFVQAAAESMPFPDASSMR